jgi:VanZ family protein
VLEYRHQNSANIFQSYRLIEEHITRPFTSVPVLVLTLKCGTSTSIRQSVPVHAFMVIKRLNRVMSYSHSNSNFLRKNEINDIILFCHNKSERLSLGNLLLKIVFETKPQIMSFVFRMQVILCGFYLILTSNF